MVLLYYLRFASLNINFKCLSVVIILVIMEIEDPIQTAMNA
jgi:hypothetical protein